MDGAEPTNAKNALPLWLTALLLVLVLLGWYGLVFRPFYESGSDLNLVVGLFVTEALAALVGGLLFRPASDVWTAMKIALPAVLIFVLIFAIYPFFTTGTYSSPEGQSFLLFAAIGCYLPIGIGLTIVTGLLIYLGTRLRGGQRKEIEETSS